jgi:hypothetical protein
MRREEDNDKDGGGHDSPNSHAKLAPETFTFEITDHLFDLIQSREHWLVGPSLEAVSHLPVDGSRLCNAALIGISCVPWYCASALENGPAMIESKIPTTAAARTCHRFFSTNCAS